MELFNHISVAVSIILSISAAHLLSGLRDVIAPQRRDWLVTCWYAYLGYLHLLVWWSLFAVHNIANWNLGTFAITMAVPGSLYLAVRGSSSYPILERTLPEDSPLVFLLLWSFHRNISGPGDSFARATTIWSWNRI